jgi:hypothetical protein
MTHQDYCVCGDEGREVIRLTHFQGQSQGQGPYLLLLGNCTAVLQNETSHIMFNSLCSRHCL